MCFNNLKCVEHRKPHILIVTPILSLLGICRAGRPRNLPFPPLSLLTHAPDLCCERTVSSSACNRNILISLDATSSVLNMCQLGDSFLLDRSQSLHMQLQCILGPLR